MITLCKKEEPNSPPLADFTISPEHGNTDTVFTFDASGCSDKEDASAQLQVRWDWESDGTWDTQFATIKTTTNKFIVEGKYNISLEVKDSEGLKSAVSKQLDIIISFAGDAGTFTDSRDHEKYKWVKIGNQIWMAENLNFDRNIFSWCYNNNFENGKQLGRLYSWPTSMDIDNYNTEWGGHDNIKIQGICPTGWHLPSPTEWQEMTNYLGGSNVAGKKMKSEAGWYNYNNGTNESGFDAKPAGTTSSSGQSFGGLYLMTMFWTATEYNNRNAGILSLSHLNDIANLGDMPKSYAYSVRCIQGNGIANTPPTASFSVKPDSGNLFITVFTFDASESKDDKFKPSSLRIRWDWENDGTWDTDFTTNKITTHQFSIFGTISIKLEVINPNGLSDIIERYIYVSGDGYDTFTDLRDGNVYLTISIGSQIWMAENLAYLPSITTNESDIEPCYYVYYFGGLSEALARVTDNYYNYGVLYNWEASKTACPDGWHLPTDQEWKTLEKHLGMSSSDADGENWRSYGEVGKKLKSATGWNENGNGANSSGFNVRPGGQSDYGGHFLDLGNEANYWTSTPDESIEDFFSRYRKLTFESDGVYRQSYYRRLGFSVRCIKD